MAKNLILDLRHTKLTTQGIINLANNMNKVGEAVKQLNEEQIEKKQNAKGSKFKPYTAKYAERKGVSRSDVTLVGFQRAYSDKQKGDGHMMDDFGVTNYGKGFVEVGFSGIKSKQKAAGNYEIRPFVGLTKNSKNRLFKWIRQKIFKKNL
jgi:hypothetical protein